jgi:hypothetical protein
VDGSTSGVVGMGGSMRAPASFASPMPRLGDKLALTRGDCYGPSGVLKDDINYGLGVENVKG